MFFKSIPQCFKALFFIVVPLISFPLAAQTVDDEIFWQSAKGCENQKRTRLYLKTFPEGKYALEAEGCIEWESIKDCEDIGLVEAFLREYSENRYVEDARVCLAQLEKKKRQNVLVERILSECRAHYESYRFTTGSGGNALDCYRRVLDQDPGNKEALSGIARIEQRYIDRAETALEQSRPDAALPWIERLASINPEHPLVEELKVRVEILKERLATRDQLLRDIETVLADGDIEQARSLLESGRKEILDGKTVSSLERKIERAKAEVERVQSLLAGVARVHTLIAEGGLAAARSAIDELADQGLDEARRAELESALIEAERERSLLDGVARARALIAEGALVAARSAIEELVDQGLDEAGRAELESALVAKVSDRLARCEGHRQSERLAAALGCCREVLEYDENNGEASACIVRVSWLMVDDERTVEGYYRFEREYPESVFAGLARLNLEEVEVEYWRSIEGTGDVSKYRRYLEIYPEGEFSSDARSRSSSQ